MQLHELQRTHKNRSRKRVGRGGVRGKTSGRGTKGQKARGNTHKRPEMRDIIKKLPKLRGHGKNRARTVNDSTVRSFPVNLYLLETSFKDNETVSPKTLVEKHILTKRGGKFAPVKILGHGTLSKKLVVAGCKISLKAREQIEKVGGTITSP